MKKITVLHVKKRVYVHAWTYGEEQLNLFLKDLNEFHPNLKFTNQKSHDNVDFLDLQVSLKDGAIFTDGAIFPLPKLWEFSRLCLLQNDFNAHISSLKDWFLARNYPQKFVGEQINQLVFGNKQIVKILLSRVWLLLRLIIPNLKTWASW